VLSHEISEIIPIKILPYIINIFRPALAVRCPIVVLTGGRFVETAKRVWPSLVIKPTRSLEQEKYRPSDRLGPWRNRYWMIQYGVKIRAVAAVTH
jgi:hypothetical protein